MIGAQPSDKDAAKLAEAAEDRTRKREEKAAQIARDIANASAAQAAASQLEHQRQVEELQSNLSAQHAEDIGVLKQQIDAATEAARIATATAQQAQVNSPEADKQIIDGASAKFKRSYCSAY